MNARQTAAALSIAQFTRLCSALDAAHGDKAKKFDVLAVDSETQLVTVMLSDNTRVEINARELWNRVASKKVAKHSKTSKRSNNFYSSSPWGKKGD